MPTIVNTKDQTVDIIDTDKPPAQQVLISTVSKDNPEGESPTIPDAPEEPVEPESPEPDEPDQPTEPVNPDEAILQRQSTWRR